ncbi:MAG: patatin [Microbacterium sp.]|uniref:Patatin n=1 Tax=Microbacterium ginsengisoli TaxID=400772 RepID=A0A3C1KDS4_9MICO|nr:MULTISPECIES: patatin-like phospholipase family protein [Microbacterium]MAL07932.1 patatin [Microbacterium sp.]MBN9209703.1 patatin-like phospholipase family protein [Microbacterium ginsengisoli]MCK9919881.1 patatin-like phospholipase family protein [Microbacteriaceae bacterium K1510]HAN24386.1 patatin [Microbacterium ginsengisoli]
MTSPSPGTRPATRAVVFGGGGSTGNAWSIGVVHALAAHRVDVTSAHLTIGTSAGATVAAQLCAASAAELFARALAPLPTNRAPSPPARRPPGAVSAQLDRTARLIAEAADPTDLRRRLGIAAIELDVTGPADWRDAWHATVRERVGDASWPDRELRVTAVDADSGEPVVFDPHSGISLVDAVAASCASGRAYRIGDRRYIDGGYRRSSENADLAAGYDRVLVLSPFGGRVRTPAAWRQGLAHQVDELRESGSIVETLLPDSDVEHLFGANAMDAASRPAAARSGFATVERRIDELRAFWG